MCEVFEGFHSINKKTGDVTFTFFSTSTYPDKPVMVVNPKKGFALEEDPDRAYTHQIRITDFFKWAKTKPGYKSAKQLKQKELKEIMEVADIEVWDNSPAFQLQGANYINSTFDASIYPETREPKRWNKQHDSYNFLTKHLYTIFNNINFYINPMTSMVNKRLKDMK